MADHDDGTPPDPDAGDAFLDAVEQEEAKRPPPNGAPCVGQGKPSLGEVVSDDVGVMGAKPFTVIDGGKAEAKPPKAGKAGEAKPSQLSGKQERFVLAFIGGMNGSDAYRHAYSAGNMADNSIHVEASRLLSNPKVTLRLRILMQKREEAALHSARSTATLVRERLQYEALTADADAARVRALELLGKMHDVRLFTEVIDSTGDSRTSEEIDELITVRLRKVFATKVD